MDLLRAVAGTNVLVAAAITPRGLCGRLLDAALEGRWQPVASPQLLAELNAVLAREKFRRWLTEDDARRFVADIRALCDVLADPPAAARQVSADPKDEFLPALARVATVRARLIAVPARIARSARRVRLRLPTCWPWQEHWQRLATAVGLAGDHDLGPPAPTTP